MPAKREARARKGAAATSQHTAQVAAQRHPAANRHHSRPAVAATLPLRARPSAAALRRQLPNSRRAQPRWRPCLPTASAPRQLLCLIRTAARSAAKNKQLGILRAKVSLDGWVYGEGERTLLRQLDGGEDDAALLRVDFVRLRGVSAHL